MARQVVSHMCLQLKCEFEFLIFNWPKLQNNRKDIILEQF